MARLGNISGKEAAKAFENAGWRAIGQVGSHLVMVQECFRVDGKSQTNENEAE